MCISITFWFLDNLLLPAFQYHSDGCPPVRRKSSKAVTRFTHDPETRLRNPAFLQHPCPVDSQNFNSDANNVPVTGTPR